MQRFSILDAVEGYYLANILRFLHREGILDQFRSYEDAARVAVRRGYDVGLFGALMEFVHIRSRLFEQDRRKRYRLRRRYQTFYATGFQLEKFVGAYGATVERLGESLTLPDLGRSLVNRAVEAAAYERIGSPPNPLVVEEIRKRGLKSLLDVGCGPATLLTLLAADDPTFRGWGLDADKAMLAAASRSARKAKLSSRIALIHADARRLASVISKKDRAVIDAIHCKGLFDELFRDGDGQAVAFLRTLKNLFPGKLLFVVDYYGKLTRCDAIKSRHQHTLIHDVLQVLTAQGVPPATLGEWATIYDAANCALLHAYEGESSGIDWFVHLVLLAPARAQPSKARR